MKKRGVHSFSPCCRVMWFVWVALSLCLPILSIGQGTPAKYSADTAAINHLFNVRHSPDSAFLIFDSALKLSIKANYADGAFQALMSKGIKYIQMEDNESARSNFREALIWAPKASDKVSVAWGNNNLGITYFNEGDYIHASEYYFTALKELNKADTSPTRMAVNIYNNIGNVNTRLRQYDKSTYYYDRAAEIARAGKFDFHLAQAYILKGEFLMDINKKDSALKYYHLGMEIGKKKNMPMIQAFANQDIGRVFVEIGNYEEAISCLQQAIAIAKNINKNVVSEASFSLADAWYHMKKYKKAEITLLSLLEEGKKYNNKNTEINCFDKLKDIYIAIGKYKKALDCMDSAVILKDTLTSTEKAKAINMMEIKYNTAEKDKQIAQNQLLIAQQKNNITQKNIWIISVFAGIILLGLLLMVLYRNARHKERLQAEQIKTLQKENTIGILKGVVQGEENERTRLARELHDGIGGMLSAAMMRFMAIRHDNEAITKIPAYQEAMNLLDEMGGEIRKTAHNLMPEVLLKQTLPEAIGNYCNSIQESGGIRIDFQSYGSFGHLTENFKLNVYRIVQELLKNITQHAHAKQALVQLMINKNILTVTVEDNGIGFNTNEVKHGLGLHNLQTRVSSLDGHFTLESEPGKGTSVYIEFETQS